jgi:hypothetical protein
LYEDHLPFPDGRGPAAGAGAKAAQGPCGARSVPQHRLFGSSALAALDCGVETFIGFDLEEEYVRIAKAALNNATPPLFGPGAF